MTQTEFRLHGWRAGEMVKVLMFGETPCEVIGVDMEGCMVKVRNTTTGMIASWKCGQVEPIVPKTVEKEHSAEEKGAPVLQAVTVDVKIRTNLEEFKRRNWKKRDLTDSICVAGKDLRDCEVRTLVQYGIDKGYGTEADFAEEDLRFVLGGFPGWEDIFG